MSGKEVKVGQTWKSKNPDTRFGHSIISIIDILTEQSVVVSFKWEGIKDDVGVFRTFYVETILNEYHQL